MPRDEGVQGYADGFGNAVLLDDGYTYQHSFQKNCSVQFVQSAIKVGPLLQEFFPGTFRWRFVTNEVIYGSGLRVPHRKHGIHRTGHMVLMFCASESVYLPCTEAVKALSAFDPPTKPYVSARAKRRKNVPFDQLRVGATYGAPDCLELRLANRIKALCQEN